MEEEIKKPAESEVKDILKLKKTLDPEVKDLFVPKTVEEEVVVEKEKDFEDVLKMFAPGTSIRTALDDLLRARMGALIVLDNGHVSSIIEKGFRVNSRFTAQRLVELAKMDGAIILSKNAKRILSANAVLIPNPEIPSRETGTRHKAAERTAKQAKTIVIAVSERKNKISLYYNDIIYHLVSSPEILRRAAETLQILEKQKEVFNELLDNLNLLELKRMVTIKDICSVIQRLEIVKRIANIVKRYLIELGQEGLIIRMRLKELIGNIPKEEELILKDYFSHSSNNVQEMLEKMNFDFLLDPLNISRLLFEELHDKPISPKGLRILSKTNLLDRYVDALIGNLESLNNILTAKDKDLLEILESEGMVAFFREEIYNLKEKVSVGKRI